MTKLGCLCLTAVISGLSSLASAQQPRGVLQDMAPRRTPAAQEGSVSDSQRSRFEVPGGPPIFPLPPDRPYIPLSMFNTGIDVGMCSWFNRPTWCKGSDVGAWTNSAIAVVGCGEVYIPAGTYTQTTSILKPRCVKLRGASAYSTVLVWSPTTGVAIIMADSAGASHYGPEGALEDLTLLGPGSSTTTCGIYIGASNGVGCAPPTSIDPSSNYGDHDNINRVRINQASPAGAFGVGIQWGNNAWSDTIFQSDIAYNGTGIFVPGNTSQTGENLSILNSYIQDNKGIGLDVATGNNINFTVINTSLDYNGSWAVQNGTARTQNTVSLINCYVAQRSRWLQNYGYMNLTGVYANDGADSGILGYLIDNEAAFLTSLAGQFFNNGTGSILNPSGVPSTWIAPLVTNPGPNGFVPTQTYVDRLGDVAANSLYIGHVNQLSPNQVGGTSTCASGTKTIVFSGPYVSAPVVLVFDETTKGGINLVQKGNWGFTVSCVGASDTFDWMVIGNPY